MDTMQSIAIYTLSVLLFLLGAYALIVAWVPIPAKYLQIRMSRGFGARIAGLVFMFALPLVYFVAPDIGRGDAIAAEMPKHLDAVVELTRQYRQLADENMRDRDDTKESRQRVENRLAEMKTLTERLRETQQAHEVRLAQHEVKITREWQWKWLSICFGLGCLIARYTGKDAPKEQLKNDLPDKASAQA